MTTNSPMPRRPERMPALARQRWLRAAVPTIACILLGACRSTLPDAPTRFAQVDGRREAYVVMGHGAPPLVLIAGAGDNKSSFRGVVGELAQSTTVIAYDRFNFGESDAAASGPRDADAAVHELHQLLLSTGVQGPYVLLGHSLGGDFAEYYAALYPQETAGLILEDEHAADFTRQCEADLGPSACALPWWAKLVYSLMPAVHREVDALERTIAQVSAASNPARRIPTLVMSHSHSLLGEAEEHEWLLAQQRLAAKYGTTLLVAPDSGHYIHKDARGFFLAQVKRLLEEVRRGQAAGAHVGNSTPPSNRPVGR